MPRPLLQRVILFTLLGKLYTIQECILQVILLYPFVTDSSLCESHNLVDIHDVKSGRSNRSFSRI